jgi:hypothetical protein
LATSTPTPQPISDLVKNPQRPDMPSAGEKFEKNIAFHEKESTLVLGV